MGVTQNVAIVELKDVREIIHSGNHAVYNSRFDDVLPPSPQELPIEDSLHSRRTDLHRPLQGLSVDSGVLHDAIRKAFRVIGLMEGKSGSQGPAPQPQR